MLKMQVTNREVEMILNELAGQCWATAETHGWHETGDTLPVKLLMMHSEISEATEDYRVGNVDMELRPSDGKPEGLVVELVDAFIRIMDAWVMIQQQYDGVPSFGTVLLAKMSYNETRPRRHGGKAI